MRPGIFGFDGFVAGRKATAYDHFQDEVVSGSGQANADAKVELPLWRDIEIDGRKNLMLLFALRIKPTQRAEPVPTQRRERR